MIKLKIYLGGVSMAELTINQLIKLILGILVVVAVVIGVYFVFKNQLAEFIKNIGSNTTKIILSLI